MIDRFCNEMNDRLGKEFRWRFVMGRLCSFREDR